MDKFYLKHIFVVILGRYFNPEAIEHLLDKYNIKKEDIISKLLLPDLSVFDCKNIRIIAEVNRIEVFVKNIDAYKNVSNIIKDVIEIYRSCKFNAIGYNFIYQLKNINMRTYFSFKNENLLKEYLKNLDIGGILRYKYNEFIVTLRIDPVEMKAYFNYHLDVHDVNDILSSVEYYDEMLKNSEKVLEVIFK